MSADDASTACPARDDAEGWRDAAIHARAALYLLKVATARPDLTPHDAWRRELAQIHGALDWGVSRMGDDEWSANDWRRDALAIMTHYPDLYSQAAEYFPNEETARINRYRARVMALLNDQ